MNSINLPEDCSKQWDLLLLLLSSEEKKIDRTTDSEIEVMSYFYKHEGIRKILLQWLGQMHESYAKKKSKLDTATKSDEISLHWRHKGNENFRNNYIEESYKCYSKSVQYAEPGGPMFPLAFANRSASLLRLKRYQECMSDIEHALVNRYPREQQHKLYLRQADCLIELRQATRAQQALKEAREHAESLQLPAVHANEFDRHLKVIEKKLDILGPVNVKTEEPEPSSCLLGENHAFVSASSVLELKRSDTAGRYVVTKQATQRGDVLFAEDPYAFVALPLDGDLAIVCEQCCRGDVNCVPCKCCSRAVYCGERCRDAAWDQHHRFECIGAQSRLFPTIGIAHLALRVLLVSASHGFPALPQDAKTKQTTAQDLFKFYSDCDNVQIYKKDTPAFYRMFNLVTNFDKMNNADYIQYGLTATMLALYLESFTTFFPYLASQLPSTMSSEQVKLFASAFILRSLGQLVCNGHAALSLATFDDSGKGESRTLSEREVRHATAIYPSAAMMNHSCDPNIVNTFHRHRLVIRGGRELAAGAEVLNCYGPHRARELAADRRARLRAQYLFHCNCTACADGDRKDAVLLFSAYACPSCKGPVLWARRRAVCQQCRREPPLQAARLQLQHADDLEAQAEKAATLEERCEKLHEAFKLKQQVWHRHHTALRDAADRLARVHAEMGDFGKSVELIKQNIQSLEYHYGSFSVEVAHELRKLADVMLERMFRSPQHSDYRDWCLETHKIIKKAYQLMELNYGGWEPLVRRLKRQEAAVAAQLAGSRTPDAAHSVHHNLHYNLKI
ncbi:hypothetical protein JYU34_000205 [Plutella xylostella]|uniref:Protein-lysine N-methyltransferase SMYD4 n=1 Tax=Plutella xylostella TaxID=51655 RepID=A0ABQ7R746_PLUXY|nr:hypothetical protein JYU34_000205 [Plutella xylostella]